MRWLVLASLLTGCGRFGFGESRAVTDGPRTGDAGIDVAGASDGAIDAAPDAPPLPLAFIQASTVIKSGGGPVTATLATPSTAGSLLVATIASNDPTSLSLPPGWQVAVQMYTSGNCASTILYYPNNPGGITTVAITVNAAQPTDSVLTEWQGVRGASPVDVTAMNNSNNPQTSQTVTTPSSTTAAGDLALAMFCEDVNNPTYASAGGWTNIGTVTNTSALPSFNVDYQLSVPMGLVAETVTSSVGGKYQAAMATFFKQ